MWCQHALGDPTDTLEIKYYITFAVTGFLIPIVYFAHTVVSFLIPIVSNVWDGFVTGFLTRIWNLIEYVRGDFVGIRLDKYVYTC